MEVKDLTTKDARQNQKHFINVKLVDLIEYRQSRKWYVSTEGWKEILLLMLGGFVGSFAKVIDFWFNNQENDNKLLEHADD